MTDEETIEALKALAHAARLQIVQTLVAGEYNVGELEDLAGIGQPGLSQQLAVLRKARLVTTRREAKLVYYRLEAERMAQLAQQMVGLVSASASKSENQARRATGVANFARLS